MKKYTRRQFIKTSGSALVGASVAPFAGFNNSTLAPSDTVAVGLIGCRSMGFGDLENALKVEGVVCRGLCDIDRTILEERAAEVEQMTGEKPALYKDYRNMLESDDLDAVIIGTPDHWHCLNTVHALQAGKHVYVEKPLANSIAEVDVMKKAAKRYGKVVQVGQQQRSGKHWQEIVNIVQSGGVGKIRHVNIWGNFGYGSGPDRVEDSPVPDGVDYDMWLGPAPERPFNRNRFHGSWRFFWDHGGGVQTDWGAHLVDVALWAMNIDGPPLSVQSSGGIFSGENNAIEMADTQTTTYRFKDFNIVWQHNGGLEVGPFNRNYGVAFVGNDGTLVVNREGWEIIPERSGDDTPVIEPIPFQQGVASNHDLHAANFIDSIQNGGEPNCPIEAGHLAAYYTHLGNVAYRANRQLEWNDEGQLINENDFSDFIKPEYRTPWTFPRI